MMDQFNLDHSQVRSEELLIRGNVGCAPSTEARRAQIVSLPAGWFGMFPWRPSQARGASSHRTRRHPASCRLDFGDRHAGPPVREL